MEATCSSIRQWSVEDRVLVELDAEKKKVRILALDLTFEECALIHKILGDILDRHEGGA